MGNLSFYFTRIMLLMVLVVFIGCSETGLQRMDPVDPPRGDVNDLPVQEFRDCSQVLQDYYWYENHQFGVVMMYGGCLVEDFAAYLVIEHEFWTMEAAPVEATYETQNGDVVTADAWKYTLDFWYNPVDIEIEVVPHMDDIVLGIHEFKLNCVDDDQLECDVEYLGSIDTQDFE